MARRFQVGLAAFGVLGVLAGVTLEGDLRIVTLIVLGAFALKSWIAMAKSKTEEEERGVGKGDSES